MSLIMRKHTCQQHFRKITYSLSVLKNYMIMVLILK